MSHTNSPSSNSKVTNGLNTRAWNSKTWIRIICILICIWIIMWIIPTFFDSYFEKHEKSLLIAFTAVTALFTGIAFIGALSSLNKQQRGLDLQRDLLQNQQESLKQQQEKYINQINVNTFSNSVMAILFSKEYRVSRRFIESDEYTTATKLVKKKNIEHKIWKEDEKETVGLNDIRKLIDILEVNNEDRKTLIKAHERIRDFCMIMDYLGVLVNNGIAADLILTYYAMTIKTTYERLNTLIEKTREQTASRNLYMNYTEMYNKAKTLLEIQK